MTLQIDPHLVWSQFSWTNLWPLETKGLAVSGMPLKWCKWNWYNTGSLSEKLIRFTVCVFFFCQVYIYQLSLKQNRLYQTYTKHMKSTHKMGRVNRIWYLSPMRAAKVQASLRIRAVSPEPPLLAYTSSESRGTFKQKARSLAPLNGWACAVKICHDGMLEDTNSLDAAQIKNLQTLTKATLSSQIHLF